MRKVKRAFNRQIGKTEGAAYIFIMKSSEKNGQKGNGSENMRQFHFRQLFLN
jgi:hypothetical protein